VVVLLSGHQRVDLLESVTEMILLHLQVVAGLEIEPEAVAGAEVAGQAERGVSGHSPRAMHDLVDPTRRHPNVDGKSMLSHPEGGKGTSPSESRLGERG